MRKIDRCPALTEQAFWVYSQAANTIPCLTNLLVNQWDGARQMAQWVKCLVHMYEDPSLNPQSPHKAGSPRFYDYNPSTLTGKCEVERRLPASLWPS